MEKVKKIAIRILCVLLTIVLVLVVGVNIYFYTCDHAGDAVYEYENKDLWFNSFGIAKGTVSMNLRVSGAKDLGWKFGDYINSPTGEWVANQYKFYFQGYKEDDPEIYEYWESLGMKREIYHIDNKTEKYIVFTPMNAETEKFPVMFVMHGGSATPYITEWYGFVEEAAERGYMVVIPEWEASLSKEQEAEVKASGLDSYEAYATKKVIDELLENGYPMDTTRMYVAGISGGGNAAAYVAAGLPEYFAASSPATGAAIQGNGVATAAADKTMYEQLAGIREYGGQAMMMIYGLWDSEYRWPVTENVVEGGFKANKLTVAERIENVNIWFASCGAVKDPETVESVAALIAANNGKASSYFGISFDNEYSKTYEVEYYFGDSYNENGDVIVRYMAIENGPHFVSPMWASEFYDFCEHYSRDPETHMLIIE